PVGSLFHPPPHLLRRATIQKLAHDRWGNEDRLIKAGEQHVKTEEKEIVQRAGVGNDAQRPAA
ncbi:MAG: hypothetical protein C4321_10600, partial [Chloroflexota bacterium]